MISDTYLQNLLQRREQYGQAEESYLNIKIQVITGVRHMYEQYHDRIHKFLQTESTNVLREVLDDYDRHTTITHPETSSISSTRGQQQRSSEYLSEEDIMVHRVPIPISPIRDIDSVYSHRHSRAHRHSSTSLTELFEDVNMQRDYH